ncbi:MAG: ankyrin repeat domain-containing protein [Alphaproteobacteria bacterium]|nr:ankyrin repeat domain-containing protein [Alphaproteobacteria bacterium]
MRDVDEKLHQAIRMKDLGAVGDALALGASPDAAWSLSWGTMVAHAAMSGTAEVLARLLKAGGSPDRIEGVLPAPLDMAMRSTLEWRAKARLLLDAGASPDGVSALTNAAQKVDQHAVEAVKLLLDAGADPDRVEPGSHWTALTCAVCSENAPLAALLVDHGARADVPIRFDTVQAQLTRGMTAWHIGLACAAWP